MTEIDRLVLGIMEMYGTNNPYEILDVMGIDIKEVQPDNPLLLQRNSVFIDALNIIYIRNDLHENYKIFYLRHELGHVLMHLDTNNLLLPNLEKYEKQANYFAFKLSNITLDEIELYQMTIEQIASSIEMPIKVLKQLVNI